jgi:hypothetical protein
MKTSFREFVPCMKKESQNINTDLDEIDIHPFHADCFIKRSLLPSRIYIVEIHRLLALDLQRCQERLLSIISANTKCIQTGRVDVLNKISRAYHRKS